jgi:hypothetical protein
LEWLKNRIENYLFQGMIFILGKYRNFQSARRLIEPPKKAGNGQAGNAS